MSTAAGDLDPMGNKWAEAHDLVVCMRNCLTFLSAAVLQTSDRLSKVEAAISTAARAPSLDHSGLSDANLAGHERAAFVSSGCAAAVAAAALAQRLVEKSLILFPEPPAQSPPAEPVTPRLPVHQDSQPALFAGVEEGSQHRDERQAGAGAGSDTALAGSPGGSKMSGKLAVAENDEGVRAVQAVRQAEVEGIRHAVEDDGRTRGCTGDEEGRSSGTVVNWERRDGLLVRGGDSEGQARRGARRRLNADASASPFPIHRLPADLLLDILTRVPFTDDVARAAAVCKRWNELLEPLTSVISLNDVRELRCQPLSSLDLLRYSYEPEHVQLVAHILSHPLFSSHLRISHLHHHKACQLIDLLLPLPLPHPPSSLSLDSLPPCLHSLKRLTVDEDHVSPALQALLSLSLPSLTSITVRCTSNAAAPFLPSHLSCLQRIRELHVQMASDTRTVYEREWLLQNAALMHQRVAERIARIVAAVASLTSLRMLRLCGVTPLRVSDLRLLRAVPLLQLTLADCSVNSTWDGEEEGGDADERRNPLLGFTTLQRLDVRTSRITGTCCLFHCLYRLTDLRSLTATVTTREEASHIRQLTALTSLSLTPDKRAATADLTPASIASAVCWLSALQQLSLTDFKAGYVYAILRKAAGAHLPRLTSLAVTTRSSTTLRQAERPIVEHIARLTRLQELSLAPAPYLPLLPALSTLTALTRLTLLPNHIDWDRPEFDCEYSRVLCDSLPSLRCLDATQFFPSSEALPQLVADLPGLESIVVSRWCLENEEPGYMAVRSKLVEEGEQLP